jgi:fatty acid desaturase
VRSLPRFGLLTALVAGGSVNDGDVYKVLAELIRAVLLITTVATAWLVQREIEAEDRRAQVLNIVIVLALMATTWSLLALDLTRLDRMVPLLLIVAFNLGRWRGIVSSREARRTHEPVEPLRT